MFTIQELRQKSDAAVLRADAISKTLKAENRDATEEERKAFDAALDEHEKLEADTKRAQRLEDAQKAAAAAAESRKEPIRQAAQVHNNAEDAPFGPEARSGETKEERRQRVNLAMGDFLTCVRSAAIQPSSIDPRLQKRAALGANEKIGSEGGFLVGKDESAAVLADMNEVGILAPKCQEIPISSSSNAVTLNGVDETSRADGSRWGGVRAYWADEAGTTTATKPKFRQISLKLNKLFAVFYATDEVIADAATLGSLASKAFAEEMAFKVDDAIVRGVGAGQPLGVLNSGTLVSVSKETGQAATTVVYENIVKMYARCHARSRSRAAWYINQDIEPQLMTMSLPVGTGGAPVYLPAGGASAAPFATLLGRPIIPIEHCSTLGTVGDIILADFSQYLLATKGGLQQAESMHVQFLTGEMTFRFTYRVDGQTQRASALTPFKGTNTLSSFVALATRA